VLAFRDNITSEEGTEWDKDNSKPIFASQDFSHQQLAPSQGPCFAVCHNLVANMLRSYSGAPTDPGSILVGCPPAHSPCALPPPFEGLTSCPDQVSLQKKYSTTVLFGYQLVPTFREARGSDSSAMRQVIRSAAEPVPDRFINAGLRMRHPQGLVAGMMWFDPDRPDALSNIRHLAQERDGTFLSSACPLHMHIIIRLGSCSHLNHNKVIHKRFPFADVLAGRTKKAALMTPLQSMCRAPEVWMGGT